MAIFEKFKNQVTLTTAQGRINHCAICAMAWGPPPSELRGPPARPAHGYLFVFFYWTSYGRLVIKRCFAFFSFFSAATIPKLSPDGYARNLARIRLSVQGSLSFWNFLKKSKNQVTTSEKHRKIGNFFDPRLTFSLAVEKRLKLFEKSFRRSKPG